MGVGEEERERGKERGEKQGKRGKGVPGAEVLATSLGNESIMIKTLRENPQELGSLQGQQRPGPQHLWVTEGVGKDLQHCG